MEYFQALFLDEGDGHYNLRKFTKNGSDHIAYITHTEKADVERIVNSMNEASRYHLPQGATAIYSE